MQRPSYPANAVHPDALARSKMFSEFVRRYELSATTRELAPAARSRPAEPRSAPRERKG